MNQPNAASAIEVVSMPWSFTQHQPLDTSTFIEEAEKRGIELDIPTLRELYRHGLLVPFIQITYRAVRPPAAPNPSESPLGGTRLMDLRSARDTGRLRDLSGLPYQARLPFELSEETWPKAWRGLLYSWYQLLTLPSLENILAERNYQQRGQQRIARLPKPDQPLLDRAEKLRKMVIALTAVEARYLPNLDPEWLELKNALQVGDWEAYRSGFDPAQLQALLQYPPTQIREDAEWLLRRAHNTDPVGSDWSRLMRRAPGKSRQYLKDAPLLALDDRIAAELLLRFYEDLVVLGRADALPDVSTSMAFHPLNERLSDHPGTLDEDLTRLGISPHPRVVLALEGESEMYHAPRVWRALEYSDAPELMRLLKLGGVNKDLTKVAALTAAPLVSGRGPGANTWRLIKPYTRLIVAVDPEGPYATQAMVGNERTKILNEIKDVLQAQGVTSPNEVELNQLVDIRTWQESCYEFEHFTDDELADGIVAVHQTIGGWSRAELVAALRYWRGRNDDIKRVWTSGRQDPQTRQMTGKWAHEVSKTQLAEALWPVLEQKIDQVKASTTAPVPPIVEIITDAYHLAQQWRYISFLLTEVP